MSHSKVHCSKCGAAVQGSHRFCPGCGAELSEVLLTPSPIVAAPPAPATAPPPVSAPAAPRQAPSPSAAAGPMPAAVNVNVSTGPSAAPAGPVPVAATGRAHSPLLALLLALLIPGAGQAYNGRPVRGFFVLFLTPLVIPWLLSVWGAWATACDIRKEGGRFGIGGFVWVFLQLWLVANVALAVLIGLTIGGVVQ